MELFFIIPYSSPHFLNRNRLCLYTFTLAYINAMTATATDIWQGYRYPTLFINSPCFANFEAISTICANLFVQRFQKLWSIKVTTKGEVSVVPILVAQNLFFINLMSLTGNAVKPSGYRIFRANYLAHTITDAHLPV